MIRILYIISTMIFLVGCLSYKEKKELGFEIVENEDLMFCNSRNCEEEHPGIVAFDNIEDSSEYIKSYVTEESEYADFPSYGAIAPGDTVKVLEKYNNEIYKVVYYNPSNARIISKRKEMYIWSGFLVNSVDSIESCWKNYQIMRF